MQAMLCTRICKHFSSHYVFGQIDILQLQDAVCDFPLHISESHKSIACLFLFFLETLRQKI